MVERIRALLAERQLTPTQFADFIGVGRPIVSHILSGRNKPSLEVIQKVINAFPDLALPWLLTGAGAMWTGLEAVKPVQSQKPSKKALNRPQSVSPTTTTAEMVAVPAGRPASAELAATAAEAYAPQSPLPPEPALPRPVAALPQEAPAPPLAAGSVAPPDSPSSPRQSIPLQALAEPDKAIRRIVIFYQDGTFSSFQPE
ncbi:helix-turn-helix domain-containing protein [Hymenobacter lutimineralis]|uniref:Helix-turn-helix domain-containing protein n=1 Tax=Hymenobacter lutimineralis TaxID=2606448 RepID=A0A5D6UVC2_9BACT|nr:helix-turn-helix domain-containing protein [Hymenobacter lutimineralis]